MTTPQTYGNGPVPEGWRWVRLGDVAEIGFSDVDKKAVEGELPARLCNYTDVFYNNRITPDMDFMGATADQSEFDRWLLKSGDVLFTKDSETADEIGIPSYVPEDLPGVLCGYHLALARPSADSVGHSWPEPWRLRIHDGDSLEWPTVSPGLG